MAKKAKKIVVQTSQVGALVADSFAELQGLGEELREWYDNLPSGLQDHRSDIDEAAQELEGLNELDDAPDVVAELEVTYTPQARKRTSRASRGSQATYQMATALEIVEEWIEANEETATTEAEREAVENVKEWRDNVQEVIDCADNVAYPGMYG